MSYKPKCTNKYAQKDDTSIDNNRAHLHHLRGAGATETAKG